MVLCKFLPVCFIPETNWFLWSFINLFAFPHLHRLLFSFCCVAVDVRAFQKKKKRPIAEIIAEKEAQKEKELQEEKEKEVSFSLLLWGGGSIFKYKFNINFFF